MKELKALIGMMLKEKLNIKYSWTFKNILRNIIPFIIKIALVTGVSYLLFFLAARFSIFGFYNYVPLTGVSIITTFIILIFTVTSVFNLSKDLYFNQDNAILLTFPINGSKIYIAKLIVHYINELSKFLTFVFPVFLGYGILIKINLCFYFWSFISLIFVCLIPIIFATIFAIPLYYIIRYFKKHALFLNLFYLFLVAIIIFSIILIIINLPTDFNFVYFWPRIYNFFLTIQSYFKIIFSPFYYINVMVLGVPTSGNYTYLSWVPWVVFVILLITSFIIILITYFLNNNFYKKINEESLESLHVKNSKKKKDILQINSKFLSLLKNEILLTLKKENNNLSLCLVYIFSPLLTLLITRIYNSIALSELGEYLAIFFTLLIICVPLFTSTYQLSTLTSHNSEIFNFFKKSPVTARMMIMSKITIPIVLSTISIISSFFIFSLLTLSKFNFFEYFIFVICAIMMQIACVLFATNKSLENQSQRIHSNGSSNYINKNEILSFIYGFIVALIFSAIYILLVFENNGNTVWVVLKMFIICVLYFILTCRHFYVACRVYYLNEETEL